MFSDSSVSRSSRALTMPWIPLRAFKNTLTGWISSTNIFRLRGSIATGRLQLTDGYQIAMSSEIFCFYFRGEYGMNRRYHDP